MHVKVLINANVICEYMQGILFKVFVIHDMYYICQCFYIYTLQTVTMSLDKWYYCKVTVKGYL